MKTNRKLFCISIALMSFSGFAQNYVENSKDIELVNKSIVSATQKERLSQSALTGLMHDIDIRIRADKVITTVTKSWYYPTKELVQNYGYENIQFNGFSDTVKIKNAVVIDPQGNTTWLNESNAKVIDSDSYNVFTEGKELILSYPALEVGGIAAITYEIVRDVTKLEGNWSAILYPQTLSEKLSYNLNVSWSEDKSIHFNADNEYVSCESGKVSISCSGKNIPGAITDTAMVWRDVLGQIVVSDKGSWQEVTDIALRGFNQAREQNVLVKDALSKLFTGDMSQEDKVSAIHEFVARDVRYVSMSESGHAIIPHAVDETLSNRFGDCKDKSALLIEMLSQIGVNAYPVLIATDREDPANLSIPSVGFFDHVIVCFDISGIKSCIDATDAYTDWNYISEWVQGKVALPLLPGGQPEKLKHAVNRWKLKTDTDLTITHEGGQLENQKVSYIGEYASVVRERLASQTDAERKRWAKDVYNDILSANVKPEFQFSGLHTLGEDVVIESEVGFDPYFEPEEDLNLVEKDPWISYELNTAKQENEHYGAFFKGSNVVSFYTIHIPDLWSIESLPAELDFKTPYGWLKRSVELVENQQIHIRTELNLPAKSLSVEQMEKFNTILDVFKQQSSIRFTGNRKS